MEPQTYWNIYIKDQMDTFVNWVGDSSAMSKVYSGKYISDNKYLSIIDLGCGHASFYKTIKDINSTIKYLGVDSCRYFILNALKNNIPILESDIRYVEDISDSSFDVCFTRHTLEHQPTYMEVLNECIRIGRKEALIIFFIKPGKTTEIKYDIDKNLYHNTYSLNDIENDIKSNNKVKYWKWIDLDEHESALHIYMN